MTTMSPGIQITRVGTQFNNFSFCGIPTGRFFITAHTLSSGPAGDGILYQKVEVNGKDWALQVRSGRPRYEAFLPHDNVCLVDVAIKWKPTPAK